MRGALKGGLSGYTGFRALGFLKIRGAFLGSAPNFAKLSLLAMKILGFRGQGFRFEGLSL